MCEMKWNSKYRQEIRFIFRYQKSKKKLAQQQQQQIQLSESLISFAGMESNELG